MIGSLTYSQLVEIRRVMRNNQVGLDVEPLPICAPQQYVYLKWFGHTAGAVAFYGSQRKAAKALGVSPTTVRRWLREEYVNVNGI